MQPGQVQPFGHFDSLGEELGGLGGSAAVGLDPGQYGIAGDHEIDHAALRAEFPALLEKSFRLIDPAAFVEQLTEQCAGQLGGVRTATRRHPAQFDGAGQVLPGRGQVEPCERGDPGETSTVDGGERAGCPRVHARGPPLPRQRGLEPHRVDVAEALDVGGDGDHPRAKDVAALQARRNQALGPVDPVTVDVDAGLHHVGFAARLLLLRPVG
ncbi:MAG TPA: hypothetical protein VIU11_13285 [Nakamurella sp.]